MIVSCPNCSTKYSLPDESARPGAKARCTVCKHVFPLPRAAADESEFSLRVGAPDNTAPRNPDDLSDIIGKSTGYNLDEVAAPAKPKDEAKSRPRIVMWLGVAVLALALAGGGAWYFMPSLFGEKEQTPPPNQPSKADLIRNFDLHNVRQYYVNNEKVGQVTVIEGKVVNRFSSPRELIKLEASLHDKDGNVLVSKQQLCGTTASLFHLQVLSEQELEAALNNKIDILTNNTNVPPNGEVPFMIVFYNPPSTVAEWVINVVDARMPPEKKK